MFDKRNTVVPLTRNKRGAAITLKQLGNLFQKERLFSAVIPYMYYFGIKRTQCTQWIFWQHCGYWWPWCFRSLIAIVLSAHLCISSCSWDSCQICTLAGCACAGNAGNVFPATNFKGNRQLAIPACITARASRTCRHACRDRLPAVEGKTFPAIPAHAQPAILRIW